MPARESSILDTKAAMDVMGHPFPLLDEAFLGFTGVFESLDDAFLGFTGVFGSLDETAAGFFMGARLVLPARLAFTSHGSSASARESSGSSSKDL